VRVYRFISDQKADFDIETLCRVCRVARSAYDAWARTDTPEACFDEAALANRVFDIWVASRRRYGAPRVTAELRRQGVDINHWVCQPHLAPRR